MRIDCIDLIRFGHFVNRKIEFPPSNPDFYVIYGDNEAGKSTLLRGISDLFFGVPARTPDVHSCKSAELRIGATISDRENSFCFPCSNGIPAVYLAKRYTKVYRHVPRSRMDTGLLLVFHPPKRSTAYTGATWPT